MNGEQLGATVVEALSEALKTAIGEQLATAWVFDNLDDTISEELKLLARDIIRTDPEVKLAMKNRLLDLVDPIEDDEEDEEVEESPGEEAQSKGTKSPPAKQSPKQKK